MTYATVCSGVEAMSLAVRGMGWSPVFFSEIEPFPCALLAHHYPSIPNLGDMTKITARFYENENQTEITNGADEPIRLRGRLGCLAGGTPCQDVSVAGKRAGMAEGSGTRSSLAFHFVRLCRELGPRWILWENVPGVLSSNGGRDFARFLDALGDCGYSLAYRVLDAQFVRVDGWPRAIPQRRRRVWVVGRRGDDWRAPAEILFEPSGLRGDNPPCRRAGGRASPDARVRAPANDGDVSGTLCARDGIKTGSHTPNGQDAYDNKLVICADGARRQTPIESERLMGFPDNYTRIPWNGKPEDECPDNPRRMACGNSWAVNCARWIVRRIDERDRLARANQDGDTVKEVLP